MAPFRHRLRVRYHECDPQGVVFNANYLAYFDMSITELWREALGGYQSMVAAGIDIVVAEARVKYLAPLRFDDEFEIVVAVAEMGTTSLRSTLRVESDGELVAEGELRHVFVDADGGDKAPIPDDIRAALGGYSLWRGKMQDDASWKQCKVMVTLAEMLAEKDPELAKQYEL